ncbi:zinc ribbon domain-containing protein [Deinococcus sp. UYEF24]
MKLTRTVSTPLRPSEPVDRSTGELLDMAVFEERCEWLLNLTGEIFNATSPAWWNAAYLQALGTGIDAAGKVLPPSGFVAADRLGWTLKIPDTLYLPDRVKRGLLVRLMSTFRARREEAPLMQAMLSLVDGVGEYDTTAVRSTPAGQWGTHVQFTRLARSITRFRKEHGRDPTDLSELFTAPSVRNPVFPFSACDKQLAVLAREDDALVLHLKLPLVPRPKGRKDWGLHQVTLNIPAFRRDVQDWSLPDLRVQAGKLIFSCASKLPAREALNADVVIGVDWSPSSLLCAGVVRKEQNVLVTDGQTSGFDDQGQLSKLLRLQREEEHTRRKARHHTRLLEQREDATTREQHDVLDLQQVRLSLKRVRLGRALAWQGANHLVNLALESGASLIAFEDLRDLDTTGRGAFQNNRSAQSVRGLLYACTEQAALRHGIEVVQIPARGTSARCPGCNEHLSRPEGYHSAACTACGLTGNRDVVACVNIAKRALLGRAKIARPKGRPKRIREVLHEPVTVKSGPKPVSRMSRQKPARTLLIPRQRVRRDRSGNRTQSKNNRFPARASLRGQVERTPLSVTGNLAKRSPLHADIVSDDVLQQV